MARKDKASNAAQKMKGKAKETAGKLTDDERLEREGKTEEAKGDVKQAGESVKDALKRGRR
ncbi:CsbD family protein [Streptomyces himalayensis]|jgi:uncharacterized protein YjbJ (UPF0337 family)|uniref:CsbD family protein n=2 Tax=Streptomyces himalayensis TaxID=2820085 RepID=A0A7W2D4L3_9ACTN|nr:CsbD family protein [Streptomyces himalayensis]MBA2950565.1 CsbD family protein [Streptomyces himalayensis subsp. himalayensis]MBA4864663.1 CsbD family protein [Streptomyces himalayensis subsp. aureolus]